MADLFSRVLLDASFEGLTFPVSECSTDGGHDAVEHVAYRRRGADIEPTGLKAYRGTLTVPLLNGLGTYGNDLFPGRWRDLTQKFETTPIGTLYHPTRGSFTALIQSWPEKASPSVRNGVTLEVHWVEHNGESLILLSSADAAAANAPANAQRQAAEADTATAAVTPAGTFVPLEARFADALAYLDLATRSYAQVTATVADLVSLVNGNLALPALAPASAHAAVIALEALRATTYRLVDHYLGTAARPRSYTVPRTMALWQVAQEVYGDASRVGLLAAANAVPDPLFVPAGRVLTVPPAG